MTEETSEATKGLSRRSFITRGAIATGAVVWATPVVDSFVSRAAAASTGGRCQCPTEGDVITVSTFNTSTDSENFLATQTHSDATGGTCASLCSEACGFTPTTAPTTYTWSFVGGLAPAGFVSATQQTPPTAAPVAYTMGTPIAAANCPPALGGFPNPLSQLNLTFNTSTPGAFAVEFDVAVTCSPLVCRVATQASG